MLLCALCASAQVAPVKPGLWEVRVERLIDGQKVPDASERLKNMPPERRAQMEAMMKQRGMGTDTMKSCQTTQTLDSKKFVKQVADCKTTYTVQSAKLWTSHTSCPSMHVESDNLTTFLNSENYTVKSTSVTNKRHSEINMQAKWLSSDCGNIPPANAEER